MPNIITHTLFADEILSILNVPQLSDHRQLFEIGSSGPDILFFHHMNPKDFYRKTRLHQLGSRLHEANINDFYKSALHSIWEEKTPSIREDMIAYACGHLCHWALDSTAHPYIFNRTGDCHGISANNHHRFESIIDSLMLKLKKNETIETYNVAEEVCKTTPEMKRAVARIYIPALESIFEAGVQPYQIAETLDDWHFMQNVFRDPKGFKTRYAKVFDAVIGRPNQLAGYAVPNKAKDNIDALNLLHKIWHNPQSGEEFERDFLELYDEAINKALQAIRLFLDACARPEDVQAENRLLEFINNRNYESGLPVFGELKYFDLIDLE